MKPAEGARRPGWIWQRGAGWAVLLPVLLMTACPRQVQPPADAGCLGARPTQVVFGGARPVTLQVPAAYDGCPAPLVLLLHGYGASGELQQAYLGLGGLVDARGVLLAAPNGTIDRDGNAFWNVGVSACCNFSASTVDDVAYLRGLIAEIRGVYAVDPKRIYLVGHSNGGFMAHRLGCELASQVAAIVSLAGATPPPGEGCHAAEPVSVLQIHGDADDVVLFDGGTNILDKGGGAYASASETVARWAQDDGCQATSSTGAPLDLDAAQAGAETVETNADGCPAGVDVTLWTIPGGSHTPQFGGRFTAPVWRWLEAHPRR